MRSLLPAEIQIITAALAGITLPEETGDTFEENALLKAHSAAQQSGRISVADDSGIVVDALEGRPGVRSARFAADHGREPSDQENNELMLELLSGVPDDERTARFVSAVAIVTPGGHEQVFLGAVEGRIGHRPSGDNGFGYDPIFYPSDSNRTMAELSDDEKNLISHRGRAFRQAVPAILGLAG